MNFKYDITAKVSNGSIFFSVNGKRSCRRLRHSPRRLQFSNSSIEVVVSMGLSQYGNSTNITL